jgi:hypothetical protein
MDQLKYFLKKHNLRRRQRESPVNDIRGAIQVSDCFKYCLINEQECFIRFKDMHERAA